MNSIGESLLNQTTTFGTNLRCIPGINSDYLTTGAPSLVVEHTQKLCPGSITHALRDVAATKPIDVQIFDGDKAELVDQSVREFMLEIPPLVGDEPMLFGNRIPQLPIALAPSLCARPFVLSESQLFLRGAKPAGIVNLLTRRQRGKEFEAHVNADLGLVVGDNGNVGQFDLEGDVPVVEFIPLDDGLLDNAVIGDRAMLKDANVPNVLNVESAILQPKPIAVTKFERAKPTNSLETRIARFLSCLDAAEERTKCLIEPAKNLLAGGVVQLAQTIGVLLANLFQLVGLVIVIDRDLLELPVVPSLLKGGIVEQTSLLKKKIKTIGLFFGWVEAKLVTAFHRLLFWASIYLRIVSADTLPAVPT